MNKYTPPPTTSLKRLPLVLLLFGLLYFALNWRDFVVQRQDGSYAVHPNRLEEAEREKEKLEECQTYKLVARESGWYLCYLCERGSVYLYREEVWKYGYTCTPETRYKKEWLQQMNLSYRVITHGDEKACKLKEIELIRDYPIHPENMKRPQHLRLVVPPGQRTLKMR